METENEAKYEVVVRIPVDEEYIKEVRALYPHLSLYGALQQMVSEENKLAEETGDPGRSELVEI